MKKNFTREKGAACYSEDKRIAWETTQGKHTLKKASAIDRDFSETFVEKKLELILLLASFLGLRIFSTF